LSPEVNRSIARTCYGGRRTGEISARAGAASRARDRLRTEEPPSGGVDM